MKLEKENLLLYLVTDRSWLHEGEPLSRRVELALKAGATMVQLREKALDFDAFVQEAREIQAVCRKYRVPFLINDRIDVAKAVDADGVHLGLSDASIEEALKELGPDKIIGASAHNEEEALDAERRGASYLGCGAVFGSKTKNDATVLSKKELQKICHAVSIPVAAIGGVNEENVTELAGLGLSGVAVVSAVFSRENPEETVRSLCEKLRSVTEVHGEASVNSEARNALTTQDSVEEQEDGGAFRIRLRVNGRELWIETGATIQDYLLTNGYTAQWVAVERNEEIVPRKAFGETLLEEGDVLEIVSFVGGG